MIKKKLNYYSFIALLLILSAYTYQLTKTHKYSNPERVIAWDARSYYAYLPATFVEKDYSMKFLSNPDTENIQMYWPSKAPNGGLVIKTSMGMAMMYSPFFFIAHNLAEPLGYKADGFSIPYAFALMFSCAFYVLIAFLFLRALLLRYYKDKIVAFTILVIGLATNLYCYVTLEAPMSHGYSFAFFCVFLFLMEKWQEKQSWLITVFLGLLIGLITLIRPTNAVIIILLLLFNISCWKNISVRIKLFLNNYGKIIVMFICTLVVWLPQLLYWKSVTGEWLYYSYGSEERFFFNDPKMLQVLFSFRNGWLIYTPSMIFAVIGIGMLWKANKKYFYPIVVFFIVNLFIVSSWWCWWYGGSFGMRALIESYAILAIPLATFFAWIDRQKLYARISLSILVFAISAQSIFHYTQYHYGAIHWDSMTKEAYFNSFWKVRATPEFDSLLFEPDYEAARNGNR